MRWTPENLNYNEQESIIELLLEKALGFENAIPEYDDTDAFGETSVKKSFCIDYFILPSAEDPKAPIPRVESRVAVCTQQEPVNLFPSVFSPPPEI
ncbi:MAG: hypothetical protein EOO48_09475 [Flavobacterium sp.]|nr:MAG: hypothetical protein EOO48_09475 [Flavobacterium sp.]